MDIGWTWLNEPLSEIERRTDPIPNANGKGDVFFYFSMFSKSIFKKLD